MSQPLSRRVLAQWAGGAALLLPTVAVAQATTQATPSGTMAPGAATQAGGDQLQMLMQEHRMVDQLFQQLLAGGDAQGRMATLAQLEMSLGKHDVAESNVVYATMQMDNNLDDEAPELYEEHARIKTELFALSNTAVDDAWTDRAREFQRFVQEHVQEEEQDIFPRIRERMDAAMLQRLTAMAMQERDMLARALQQR